MYATPQACADRHGADRVRVLLDLDAAAALAGPAVAPLERALADASAEIDAYARRRYELPLEPPPALFARLAVDIALYRLAADADRATEEGRKRYEDAVRLLERIAAGEVALGLPGPEPASAPAGAVHVAGPARRFTRRSLRRAL